MFIFQPLIFRGYVSFGEGTPKQMAGNWSHHSEKEIIFLLAAIGRGFNGIGEVVVSGKTMILCWSPLPRAPSTLVDVFDEFNDDDDDDEEEEEEDNGNDWWVRLVDWGCWVWWASTYTVYTKLHHPLYLCTSKYGLIVPTKITKSISHQPSTLPCSQRFRFTQSWVWTSSRPPRQSFANLDSQKAYKPLAV